MDQASVLSRLDSPVTFTMDTVLKRPRLSLADGYQEVEDVERVRKHNHKRLRGTFDHIFKKYAHDYSEVGDVLDLVTGEVVVDNGHLDTMASERDTGKQRLAPEVQGTAFPMAPPRAVSPADSVIWPSTEEVGELLCARNSPGLTDTQSVQTRRRYDRRAVGWRARGAHSSSFCHSQCRVSCGGIYEAHGNAGRRQSYSTRHD